MDRQNLDNHNLHHHSPNRQNLDLHILDHHNLDHQNLDCHNSGLTSYCGSEFMVGLMIRDMVKVEGILAGMRKIGNEYNPRKLGVWNVSEFTHCQYPHST